MGFLTKLKSIFGGSDAGATTTTTVPSRATAQNGKDNKYVGKITHFNYKKGYGFVEVPQMENRVFLHVSELSGKARKGKQVEFVLEATDKGVKATEAVILN